MNKNCWPPLLRGIGTTAVLLATVISVLVARGNVRAEQAKRAAIFAKAEAAAKAQLLESRSLAELKAEVEDLRAAAENDGVAEEVIENPWFNWIGFLGTATIASSFFLESYLRRSESP